MLCDCQWYHGVGGAVKGRSGKVCLDVVFMAWGCVFGFTAFDEGDDVDEGLSNHSFLQSSILLRF